MKIDIIKLRTAIDHHHHAQERFFDEHQAAIDRNLNLEMAARIDAEVHTDEDIRRSVELLKQYEHVL
ncbi:hypothetical protein vBAbaMPhT2_079 [Acinetobacter phage vB_AbaM_PhT2]|uniref:Uncharacterized protein n=1 Tax=Acinetobacter phage vB_AbaM_PhT2 TaxID=2690230 RepID=A0A6B9SW05_9CAUD|nr:hypothetical protein HYQ24_gp079 [Acinetobacter phage vB_AbaM_PhT2]QQM13737.1 hypothetical protein CPT_Maestro_003 [Acinetobacter phage Maestro]QQM18495.1 hypothetical protein CPT_Morttis_002 [Acinetobacter phage Morttis]QQO96205.1 hypothetical protein CPT_Minot_002 [Acinetobacter phage Minot]QQO96453.1 hypothetical protein CPT_Mokit_002 [Acinetobacter phage Mokit]QQO96703.1 hypothetical protein CPT_Melin_002 [Acinetobacter phage Melin]UJH94793.1 hypothetical protein PhaR5_058 [Acinetobact